MFTSSEYSDMRVMMRVPQLLLRSIKFSVFFYYSLKYTVVCVVKSFYVKYRAIH
jgi:hypothetical protein